ncbi:hypothetical protein NECAME_17370 [Necator americanus]|uniref:Uncharacterized protein n=1 Tax=Necator americanus TaxID=51031 RepID=W2TRD8_NECAM|nr:hypothetical protein NECAME_17370 [Necator americanus]ETN83696.1 hypothetical protein NECAME_17370 [Necator americanus]
MGGSIMGGHSYKRVGQRSVCVIRLLRLPDCCGREVWFVVIQRRIRTGRWAVNLAFVSRDDRLMMIRAVRKDPPSYSKSQTLKDVKNN